MLTRKSITAVAITAFVAALLSVVPLAAPLFGGDAEDDAAKMSTAVGQLRETAEKLVEYRQHDFQSGRGSVQELLEAQRQLLDVELEFAESKEARIKVLSEQLKLAKKAEELAKARREAARGTMSDVLEARMAQLRIEIALLREKE